MMIKDIIKNYYEGIQENLNSNYENSLINTDLEISLNQSELITKLNDLIINHGYNNPLVNIEDIVNDSIINDLRTKRNDIMETSYQKFHTFNASINTFLIDQVEKNVTKLEKENQIKIVTNKMKLTMDEYYNKKIDLSKQYNKLFQTIISEFNLYNNQELIETIKKLSYQKKCN